MLTLIVAVSFGLFVGRYVVPRRTSLPDLAVQRLNGTYRDPDRYKVTVGDKTYEVETIHELPEGVRETVVKGFEGQHRWMDNLLSGRRPQADEQGIETVADDLYAKMNAVTRIMTRHK